MKQPKPVNLVRRLRRRQSDAEEKLWLNLRNRQLNGLKFRRQQSLGNYIVDFISFDVKLIIEVDGGQHNETVTTEKDEQRTKWLEGKGYQVIRFWNNDVLENVEGVLTKIKEILEIRSHPHLTSPVKGEEGH
jgi:ATP-dependent helicase HrpA/adenine-specific DNA-methyltransferase